jgi:hypothetical protein
MKDFKRIDNERSAGADPELTSLLRAAYTAPDDDSYWQQLEQRVMSRISESPVVAWWAVLSEWRTAGMIAATIALLLAGATVLRHGAPENTTDFAARAAVETGTPMDEATFSFGGRRRLPADAPERYLDPFDY